MKKMMITMVMMVAIALSANAMSYNQASKQALFLTDKMAYELGMTDDQYNAVYQVNLDYFMNLNRGGINIFGVYWNTRNSDLMYILNSYQYSMYTVNNYFYRPVYWLNNRWSFGIYTRYSNRSQFFRPRPRTFGIYKGGNRPTYNKQNLTRPTLPNNNNRPNVNRPGNNRPQMRPQFGNPNWRTNGNSNNSWHNNNGNNGQNGYNKPNNGQSGFGRPNNNGQNTNLPQRQVRPAQPTQPVQSTSSTNDYKAGEKR